jgi:hypothetical protein
VNTSQLTMPPCALMSKSFKDGIFHHY